MAIMRRDDLQRPMAGRRFCFCSVDLCVYDKGSVKDSDFFLPHFICVFREDSASVTRDGQTSRVRNKSADAEFATGLLIGKKTSSEQLKKHHLC